MAIKNALLGGVDNENGQIIDAADVNDTNNAIIMNQFVQPIGSVIAWLKDLTNTPSLPSNWVECNGQVLSDEDSVYDGQTIPNLNGTENRFLRGNATSGTTGGTKTHTLTIAEMPPHHHPIPRGVDNGTSFAFTLQTTGQIGTRNSNSTGGGEAHNNEPQYYNVVWIMRIK